MTRLLAITSKHWCVIEESKDEGKIFAIDKSSKSRNNT